MQRHRLMNRLLGTATAWLVLAGVLGMLPGAPARAADQPALQAIDVQPLPGQQLQLTMRLSGPAPQPLAFTIDNPARISLDLPNTTLALPAAASRFAKPSSAAESLGEGGVVETMSPLMSPYHL